MALAVTGPPPTPHPGHAPGAVVGRTLRAYARLVAAGVRRQSTYRAATLGGLLTNATFGVLKVAVLFATVRAAGGSVRGYDIGAMSAYIWISQGLLGSLNFNGRTDVADRIRTGDVAVDFLRPVDVQGASVATAVGAALFALLPRGLPSVAIGVFVVGMDLPSSVGAYAAGLLSLVLGIVLSATTVYLVAAAGFWLVETRGLQLLYMVVSGFLAGLFVPIALFPTALRVAAEATPFPSMLMFPIEVLSGRATGGHAAGLVGAQLAWLALTVAVGQLLTRAGRRRLEVQGG